MVERVAGPGVGTVLYSVQRVQVKSSDIPPSGNARDLTPMAIDPGGPRRNGGSVHADPNFGPATHTVLPHPRENST